MRLFLLTFICSYFGFSETTTTNEPSDSISPTVLKDCNNNVIHDDASAGENVCWTPIEKTTSTAHWNAVGQLLSSDGSPTCTTTLFKPPQCNDPNAKAQMLTNGHCTKKSNDGMTVRFNMFANHKGDRPSYDANKIYESFSELDLSIVELNVNYSQMGSPPIQPVPLAKQGFPLHQDLDSVSIPLKNISAKNQTLKIAKCFTEKIVDNITGDILWNNMIALDKCPSIQGASGSSLFNSKGELVGLLNSGSTSVQPSTNKHICEMDTCSFDGKTSPQHETKNYAFDVTQLHKCYDGCKLDITRNGCPLPHRGNTGNPKDKNSLIYRITSGNSSANWTSSLDKKMSFISQFHSYLIKGCSQGQTKCNCEDPTGYKQSPPLVKSPLGDSYAFTPSEYFPGVDTTAMPGAAPQMHMLCIRGANKDGTLDPIKNVTHYPIYLYHH
jgi:V8-like Glu-specific endopeptidase